MEGIHKRPRVQRGEEKEGEITEEEYQLKRQRRQEHEHRGRGDIYGELEGLGGEQGEYDYGFATLPDELVYWIMCELDPSDMVRFAKTHKHAGEIFQSRQFIEDCFLPKFAKIKSIDKWSGMRMDGLGASVEGTTQDGIVFRATLVFAINPRLYSTYEKNVYEIAAREGIPLEQAVSRIPLSLLSQVISGTVGIVGATVSPGTGIIEEADVMKDGYPSKRQLQVMDSAFKIVARLWDETWPDFFTLFPEAYYFITFYMHQLALDRTFKFGTTVPITGNSVPDVLGDFRSKVRV